MAPQVLAVEGVTSRHQIRRLGVSHRQAQVAELLLQGRPDKQIASALGITVRTVRAHLDELFDHFNADGRVALAVRIMSALNGHGTLCHRQE